MLRPGAGHAPVQPLGHGLDLRREGGGVSVNYVGVDPAYTGKIDKALPAQTTCLTGPIPTHSHTSSHLAPGGVFLSYETAEVDIIGVRIRDNVSIRAVL